MTVSFSGSFVPTRHGVELSSLARGDNILVVSPHPDDDVIGMGGTMTLLARQYVVTSVYLTDGAGSLRSDPRQDISALRRQEAIDSLSHVDTHGAFFLHGKSEWCRHHELAPQHFLDQLQDLLLFLMPLSVYVTGPFEKHPTHLGGTDLVVRILRQCIARFSRPCKLYGYPVWSPLIGRKNDIEAIDISEAVANKRLSILAHKGEVEYKAYDEGAIAGNRHDAIFYDTHAATNGAYFELFLNMQRMLAEPQLTLHQFALDQASGFVGEMFAQS